jgi:hypothetical protein
MNTRSRSHPLESRILGGPRGRLKEKELLGQHLAKLARRDAEAIDVELEALKRPPGRAALAGLPAAQDSLLERAKRLPGTERGIHADDRDGHIARAPALRSRRRSALDQLLDQHVRVDAPKPNALTTARRGTFSSRRPSRGPERTWKGLSGRHKLPVGLSSR